MTKHNFQEPFWSHLSEEEAQRADKIAAKIKMERQGRVYKHLMVDNPDYLTTPYTNCIVSGEDAFEKAEASFERLRELRKPTPLWCETDQSKNTTTKRGKK